MKIGLFIIGLFIITYLNYWIFSNVSYSLATFSIIRASSIAISIVYFFFLIKYARVLTKSSVYLEKWGMQSNGKFFFSFVFGVIHLVLVSEGTDLYHEYLLQNSYNESVAEVVECEKSYCIYSYTVNGQYYETKFNNSKTGFENSDRITIWYYPENPLINRIKR